MSSITLELTDASANEMLTTPIPTTSTSDDSDDESVERGIVVRRRSSSELKTFVHDYLQQLKFVFQSIGPDLRSLQRWKIAVLVLYATFNFVFSILDFNSFIAPQAHPSLFKWVNEAKQGIPLWQRAFLGLSGLSAFTNVLNVVLVIHGKMSSYFWGILGAILYGAFAFAHGYVGDAQLSIGCFLPMQFVGIHLWSKQLDSKSTARPRSLTLLGWLLVVFSSGLLTTLFYYEIPLFMKVLRLEYIFAKEPVPHILDAMTNGLSVIGQFLCIARYWEQYIIWTLANLMLIFMYSGFSGTHRDINALLVWIMLTVNSSCGLYTWYHRWKNSRRSSSLFPVKA